MAAAAAGVAVGRVRRVAYLLSALGTGAVGAVLFCHSRYVQPASMFGAQYSAVAMLVTLFAPRGLWGAVSGRWDVSLLPLGYRFRR